MQDKRTKLAEKRSRPSVFKTVRTQLNTLLASKLFKSVARSQMCRGMKRRRKC